MLPLQLATNYDHEMTKEGWLGTSAGRSVRRHKDPPTECRVLEERTTMKKMMTILALASALSFAGCKKKETAATGSGSASASAGKVEDKGSGAATGSDTGSAPASGSAAASGTDTAAAASTGSPECDEYLKAFDDVVAKCKDKLGPALDAMKQSRDAQAEAFKSWGTLDEASKKATIEAAATGCKSATDALKQSATSMGCTL